MPLRRFLARLVWLAVLPLMLLGAAVSWQVVRYVQHRYEAEAQAVAAAAAASLDRFLRSRIHGLSILAESDAAAEPERLAELYALAQSFRRAFGAHVIVADLSMLQRLNTRVPLGTPPWPLLRPKGRAAVPLALQTGAPAVGDAVVNPRDGQLLIAVAVPVLRDGRALGVVLCTLETDEFKPFLDELTLPRGWSIVVRDSTGTAFAGRGPLAAVAPASSAAAPEHAVEERHRFASAMAVAPWAVWVQIPVGTFQEPARSAAFGLALAGVLASAAGVVAGRMAGRRLTKALDSLARESEQGGAAQSECIAEVAAVRRKLDEAASRRASAEAELARRERDYRLLFEQHPHPMWITEPDTLRITAVNLAALRQYGWTQEQFRARSMLDMVAADERARLQASAADGVSDDPMPRVHGQWLLSAGRSIMSELSWTDLEFEGGRARLVLAIDITARHELEQQRSAALDDALRSRNLLRETLERVSDGFVALDRDDRFTFVNRKAAQVMRCDDVQQILGHTLRERYPVADDHPVIAAIGRARSSGMPVVVEHLGDVTGRWFETRVYPAADGLTMYFSDIDERRRAQKALEDSEARYRLLFDRNPSPLWVFDQATLRFLAVNDAAIERYGYSRGEFLAMTIADIRPPEEIPVLRAALASAASLGSAASQGLDSAGEFVHRTKAGELLIVEVLRKSIDFKGRDAKLVLVRDVTERVRALEALQASERDFRILAEQMPGIVYRARLDPPGFTEYVSPQVAELGFTPAQWIGHPEMVWNAIHADDRARVQAEIAAAYAGHGDEMHLEYRFRGANGAWHERSDHARVIRPPDAPPFVLGVNVDVTRVRATEAALRRSEHRFRTLAEQMPAVIYIAPAEGSSPAVYVSPAIAALGYTPQQWTSTEGPNWQQVLHPDDRERVLRELRDGLGAAGTVRLEFRLRDHEGQWRDFVEYGRRIDGDDGVPLMQGVMIDITDLQRAQRELLASRSELSDLAQQLLTQERETTRHLAQTLHDHLGQSLAVARLHLDAAVVEHAATMPPRLGDDCARVTRTLDQAIADVRLVLGELRPPLLEDQGLLAALDGEIRPRRTDRGEVDMLLEVDAATMTVRWPADVEYGAFMIAREAVVNALLHADATLVRVVVEGDGRSLTLEIIDDGHGIAEEIRHGRPGHLGLVGMRERALAIGAQIDVRRRAEGGTCVALRWTEGPAS